MNATEMHRDTRALPGGSIDEHEARIRRFIASARWDAPRDDAPFGHLALASFRWQCERIAAYGAYARHVCGAPDQIRDWREIPPAPASAFKSHDLSAAPASSAAPSSRGVTFETSGTTISRPGRVRLSSTALYERSLLSAFDRIVLPDGVRPTAIIFGPTRAEAPNSSLWFMADRIAAELCDGAVWLVSDGEPRWDWAEQELARVSWGDAPVLLLGTTLLFLAWFERSERKGLRFQLPAGSRAMDTGGAKGQRVEIDRGRLEALFDRALGIPRAYVVNEYGMAEMGSQFYTDTLLAHYEGRRPEPGFHVPPWVRTRVLDPESMHEVADGTPGILVHYDLANLEIPLAIQTEDVGVRIGSRILLEGRLPGAERRGCSLAFERFVEARR